MPFRFAVSENAPTTLPFAGHTQSRRSSSSPSLPAIRGTSGFGSGLGAGLAAGAAEATGSGGACASARHVAHRLLRIRFLERLRLRLVVVRVARDRRGGRCARRRGPGRGLRLDDRRHRAQRRRRHARRRRRLLTRRAEAKHLPDPNQVDVLDAVPRGELLVVEAVVQRDLVERVAALHRVGLRTPVGLPGRGRTGRAGRARRARRGGGRLRRRRRAVLDRRARLRRAPGKQRDGDHDRGHAQRRGRNGGDRQESRGHR